MREKNRTSERTNFSKKKVICFKFAEFSYYVFWAELVLSFILFIFQFKIMGIYLEPTVCSWMA